MAVKDIPADVVAQVMARFQHEDPDTGCWDWPGSTAGGYGIQRWHEPNCHRGRVTHKIAYEALVGPVPEGLELDHLCRNRACGNPGHLEPVTNRENIYRGVAPSALNRLKSSCMRGHRFDEGNTYVVVSTGKRQCRTCKAEAGDRARVARSRGYRRGYNPQTHHPAKLTRDQVADIRARYGVGLASQRELAAEFGIAQSSVSKIVLGYRWKEPTG